MLTALFELYLLKLGRISSIINSYLLSFTIQFYLRKTLAYGFNVYFWMIGLTEKMLFSMHN